MGPPVPFILPATRCAEFQLTLIMTGIGRENGTENVGFACAGD